MKKLVIKTGEYEKYGKTKGEYLKLGVVLNNDNGSYVLIDPSINLAGALIKQNLMAEKAGKPARNMLMVSIFTDDNQGQQPHQQQSPQNQAPQQQNNDFDDDIPFR